MYLYNEIKNYNWIKFEKKNLRPQFKGSLISISIPTTDTKKSLVFEKGETQEQCNYFYNTAHVNQISSFFTTAEEVKVYLMS